MFAIIQMLEIMSIEIIILPKNRDVINLKLLCGFSTKSDSQFDYIFVMDNANMRNVQRFLEGTGSKAKVEMLGSYDPQGQKVISDPWAGSEKVFENTYQHIYRSLENFLKTEILS